MSLDNKNGCPHCGNRIGFAFGRCSSCGFNYLTERFETIRVSIEDLRSCGVDPGHLLLLVDRHAEQTKQYP